MNNFLEASRRKLRFATSRGSLTVEQMWDVPMTTLSECIKSLRKKLNAGAEEELEFLDEKVVVDKDDKIAFEVLKEVYILRKEEKASEQKKAESKAQNQKIMELIAQKRDQSLANKTEEELLSMLVPE